MLELAEAADTVLAGPGIGTPDAARELLEVVVPQLESALVVDALGTAFLTAHPEGVRHLCGACPADPNAGEHARVLQEDEEDGEEVASDELAGLLARGLSPARAAAWGAYVHGRAGERLTAQAAPASWPERSCSGCLRPGEVDLGVTDG